MEKNNNKKENILNSATTLFQMKGYHATGLNEILKESNAPKGSLYYYFPEGKEQLALESITLTRDYVEKLIKNRLDKTDDPIKAIQNSIIEMVDETYIKSNSIISFKSNKKISINLIALETVFTNEKLREACKETFNIWEKCYTQKLIDGGFESKKAKYLGSIIESMIEGAILMSLTKKDDQPLLDIASIIPKILND
ncbi:MAG: TetR/AcrR family transcriptional regulator [Methanobacteriaceae archaeon]|nr:TetR/AcrR family transcriptional regulator [Methanobacteriaceae archaeon]